MLARSCRELEDDECLIDHRMISNEMKLKFLESRGIVHIQWHQVYKPNERSLLFCSPDSRVQIRVGFDLSHMNLKPMWAVKDVLFQGKSHLLLFLYYCE